MDLVESYGFGKNRNNERDRGNQAMPQSLPESGHFAFVVWRFLELIRTGHTTCEYKNKNQTNPNGTENFHSLSPKIDVMMLNWHEIIL